MDNWKSEVITQRVKSASESIAKLKGYVLPPEVQRELTGIQANLTLALTLAKPNSLETPTPAVFVPQVR